MISEDFNPVCEFQNDRFEGKLVCIDLEEQGREQV